MREAGGQTQIARLTGVSQKTISRYLRAIGMKVPTLRQIALVMGVNPEWLLHGEEPMHLPRADPPPADPAAPPPEGPPTLFSVIDADRLGAAYARALKALQEAGHKAPDPRRLMQVTVLFYDEMSASD